MVLYGITLVPLTEELQMSDPVLLAPLYANNELLYGSARHSAQLLYLLLEWVGKRGYFPDPSK